MNKVRFDKNNGLVPAIVQEFKSKEILMMGYMNKESLEKTKETGYVYFWSRSRKKLWMKGEESGNKLKLKKIFVDCDNDTLLVLVELLGQAACHTGKKSCFFTEVN